MEKEDYLSLFVALYDPIAIYVFNNEVFGCELVRQKEDNPNIIMRSYSLGHGLIAGDSTFLYLLQLYRNNFCREHFPKKLLKHFEKMAEKKLPNHHRYFTQASGYSNQSYKLFLSLDIDSTKDIDSVVSLKDMSFEKSVLKQTIVLHPRDAFFILANICANAYCKEIFSSDRASKKSLFGSIKKDAILSHNMILPSFVGDYLEYLVDSFSNGELQPEYILRMSGARLLMTLSNNANVSTFINDIMTEITSDANLTKTKKIAYTTLLLLFNSQPKIQKSIKNFLKTNRELLKDLYSEIRKSFPIPASSPRESELSVEERAKTFLPLFWFQGQPIAIYVLNNELLGADTDAGTMDWGSAARPLQLLYDLNKEMNISKILSNELGECLENHAKRHIMPRSTLYDYLLGWNDPYSNTPFLDLMLKKHPKKEDSVVLHYIRYMEKSLDFEIELTSFETFILLANIYISKFFDELSGLIHSEFNPTSIERFQEDFCILDRWGELSSKENLIKKETNEEKHRYKSTSSETKREHFTLPYLKYVRDLLCSKKITPLEILRLSGAPTLVVLASSCSLVHDFVQQIIEELKEIDNLSFNRKIMYFTLLEMIDDKFNHTNSQNPVWLLVKELYEEHYSIIHSLSNLIEKPFP